MILQTWYAQQAYTDRFVHGEAFAHRRLYTETFMQICFYTEARSLAELALLLFELLSVILLRLPDHLPFVLPRQSGHEYKLKRCEATDAPQGVVQYLCAQTPQFARAYVDDVPEDKSIVL